MNEFDACFYDEMANDDKWKRTLFNYRPYEASQDYLARVRVLNAVHEEKENGKKV